MELESIEFIDKDEALLSHLQFIQDKVLMDTCPRCYSEFLENIDEEIGIGIDLCMALQCSNISCNQIFCGYCLGIASASFEPESVSWAAVNRHLSYCDRNTNFGSIYAHRLIHEKAKKNRLKIRLADYLSDENVLSKADRDTLISMEAFHELLKDVDMNEEDLLFQIVHNKI